VDGEEGKLEWEWGGEVDGWWEVRGLDGCVNGGICMERGVLYV
jgi:hypothetical protein